MVAQVKLERAFLHGIQLAAKQQGAAVCGHIVQARGWKSSHQLVHIFLAHKLEQILRLRACRERFGVQQAVFHIFRHIDVAAAEPFIQKAAVRYDVCGEDDAARLCDADGLAQGLPLIILFIKVVQRAQQQGDIVGAVRKGGKVQRIALHDGDGLAGLRVPPEHLDVVSHKLHCVHGIAPARQRVGITARARAHLQHAGARPCIFFNIAHGGEKLDGAMPACKAAVLVVIAVKVDDVLFCLHTAPLFLRRRSARKAGARRGPPVQRITRRMMRSFSFVYGR